MERNIKVKNEYFYNITILQYSVYAMAAFDVKFSACTAYRWLLIYQIILWNIIQTSIWHHLYQYNTTKYNRYLVRHFHKPQSAYIERNYTI